MSEIESSESRSFRILRAAGIAEEGVRELESLLEQTFRESSLSGEALLLLLRSPADAQPLKRFDIPPVYYKSRAHYTMGHLLKNGYISKRAGTDKRFQLHELTPKGLRLRQEIMDWLDTVQLGSKLFIDT